MEWIIVYFVDDNVVEAVPSNWVFDDTCYWPPYKGSKLMQAISSCTSPTIGEWNLCNIRQLANGQKYDNLLKAKAKCAKAEHTSDLNSEVENTRQRKKKRFFDENNSGDDIALDDSNLTRKHKISLCPTRQTQKINTNVSESSSDFSENDIRNTKLPFSPSKTAVKSLSTSQSAVRNKCAVESTVVRKSNEKENREHLPRTSTSNKSSYETIKPSDYLYDANFKQQVLRQLQIINIRQQQMSEDVSMLLMKANSEKNEPIVSNEDSIFKTYNFPLKTVPELEELEELLIQDENFNTFVKEILQIGGTSYKNMVKRILPRIMSNDLAKTYSWIGFKGKQKFSNLRTCSAILTAIQKMHGCSESAIEGVIKYWLVKATERQKQSQKEKKS